MRKDLSSRSVSRRSPWPTPRVSRGDWDWRQNPDPAWRAYFRRFDACSPWNVGNTSVDSAGVRHAATGSWEEDRRERERNGMLWLPLIYPGFSWDHLQKKSAGSTLVPRRGGDFLWEQFRELSRMGVDSAGVAMFDEVDDGTAIFKVTDTPPLRAHFVALEGRPSDWYLRLTAEGASWLRKGEEAPPGIPISP